MSDNHQEILLAEAQIIELQALDNPEISIAVDPELAEFMGAFQETALNSKNISLDKEK